MLLLLASCTSESAPSSQSVTLSSASDDYTWTYYSFEENQMRGTSTFGDTQADSLWSQRTDWDIAICGTLIRTNSGTSGPGEGGIQEIQEDYDAVVALPTTGYQKDSVF